MQSRRTGAAGLGQTVFADLHVHRGGGKFGWEGRIARYEKAVRVIFALVAVLTVFGFQGIKIFAG